VPQTLLVDTSAASGQPHVQHAWGPTFDFFWGLGVHIERNLSFGTHLQDQGSLEQQSAQRSAALNTTNGHLNLSSLRAGDIDLLLTRSSSKFPMSSPLLPQQPADNNYQSQR
jgi:hypothetical protein